MLIVFTILAADKCGRPAAWKLSLGMSHGAYFNSSLRSDLKKVPTFVGKTLKEHACAGAKNMKMNWEGKV
jgi:hypothetical protein